MSTASTQSEGMTEFLALRPAGGFGLIMADPPWSYTMRSASGYARAPEGKYNTMSLGQIKALPVELLAAPDCLLWLWAVNPKLPEAIEVVRAWGFTFKTAGTWVKRTSGGKNAFGLGYLLRSSNEPFLIATRGAPRVSRRVRSTVASQCPEVGEADLATTGITIEAVLREHSRKPDEAFGAAEALMPGASKIELFSRQRRPGWAVWGNEIDKFEGAP